MSYSTGEAAILETLKLHADYSASNTSRADWRVLDSGQNSHYAVLRMGESVNSQLTIQQAFTTWRTDIMLYERYTVDGITAVALQGHVQTVIEHLEKYPTLEGLSINAQIISVGAMEQIQMIANGPMWARSIIAVEWNEERSINYIF